MKCNEYEKPKVSHFTTAEMCLIFIIAYSKWHYDIILDQKMYSNQKQHKNYLNPLNHY